MAIETIDVDSAAGPYKVRYGRSLLATVAEEINSLGPNTGVFLLTSPKVARHWKLKAEKGLRNANFRRTMLFDDKERAKSMPTVEKLCRALVRSGADRKAVIVAAGGGVVGDVVGFVAASYLRGVKLVHIPTTLVAQVDSAIGGKTGVNLPEGKNLVGAFYPAKLVLADPDTLSTLSKREFCSGLYEVIKYGVIYDANLFDYLEKNIEAVAAREPEALDFTIVRCIRAKADVVGKDEKESGLREILNFGHTFAHAFETATNYRRYLHGEAVGLGMIAASRLGLAINTFSKTEAERIESLVRRVAKPARPPAAPAERLIEIMRSDKKTRGGRLRFVVPTRIGHVETISDISERLVRSILQDLQKLERAA